MKINMKKLFIGSISLIGTYTLVNVYRSHRIKKVLDTYNLNHQNTPLKPVTKSLKKDQWSDRKYIKIN